MTRKKIRRDLHTAINTLTHKKVAEIIRKTYPPTNSERIDALAREAIAAAHRLVSPRK